MRQLPVHKKRRGGGVLLCLMVALVVLGGAAAWAQASASAAQPARVALLGQDGAGNPFHLESTRGQVAVVVLLSRYTRKAAAPIQDALGPMAAPGKVEVISVVDMIGIPGMFRGMAHRKVLAGARGSKMRFLVDDDGTWRAYFGGQPDKRVDILVIDQEGVLRRHFIGQEQLGEAERLISELRQREPATR